MQFIELELGHDNFFCPATGERILSEESFEPSPATLGVWTTDYIEEPQHLSKAMAPAWDAYSASIDEDEDWVDIPAFLSGIQQPNWVTFAITTSGMSCGPASSTVYIVIDMDYDAGPETNDEA